MPEKKQRSTRGKQVVVVREPSTSQTPPKWVVTNFDRETLVGVISLNQNEVRFHSTSFVSNTSLRFPRVGEAVEVVRTSGGTLVSIHGE
jgi:hypothetical protein